MVSVGLRVMIMVRLRLFSIGVIVMFDLVLNLRL